MLEIFIIISRTRKQSKQIIIILKTTLFQVFSCIHLEVINIKFLVSNNKILVFSMEELFLFVYLTSTQYKANHFDI